MRTDADNQFVGSAPVDGASDVEGDRCETRIVFADANTVDVDDGAELRLVDTDERDGILRGSSKGSAVPEVIALLVRDASRIADLVVFGLVDSALPVEVPEHF